MTATPFEPLAPEHLAGRDGTLTLTNPAMGVFESRAHGRLDLAAAQAYIAYGDRIRTQPAPRFGLHDWLALEGYASGVRPLVVRWAVWAVRDFQAIHVALRAPVVRMGVTMANVAVGDRIRMYDDEASFRRVREEIVAALPKRADA